MVTASPPPDRGDSTAPGSSTNLAERPDGVRLVDPEDRTYQPLSLRTPAFIVLGLAVLIVVVGLVASAFTSGSTPGLTVHQITIPDGTVVHLTPATEALKSIVGEGQPPADILGPLAVPAGSTVTGTVNIDQNAGQFDRTVDFTTGLSADQVVSLFHTLLPKLGWHVTSVGPSDSGQGTEVLAQKGSGDSFYWEVGIVASPTTSAGTTPFTVELFEQPDNN